VSSTHATAQPEHAAGTALVWHSSFASFTGYSGSALALVLGLDARGLAVRPLYVYGADHDELLLVGRMHPRILELQRAPVRLDAPQVVYAPGDRFSKNSGSYRVGFTMLEVDRLPGDWASQANQMDEVWTPSAWGVEVFRASGVTRPVYPIPLGVDPGRFHPGPPRQHLRDRTVFLSVFEWSIRKGWDVLLRAYRAAFQPGDPVLLVLKIDCRTPEPNPLRQLAELLPEPSPPVALIYNQALDAAQMAELYQGADCFVLPTRGEGWGMPILEAMACGLPAISTDWSAPCSFVTAENGYPLPVRALVAANQHSRYTRGAQWAEPDLDMLVELLRQVAADPAGRRARGARAAADAQQWTWERSLDAILARLRESGAYDSERSF
jgi:glycosyltransferase involved in cell wall biosynthesis